MLVLNERWTLKRGTAIHFFPHLQVRKNFGLFSHRRTRSDPEEDYVCPLSLKQVLLEREAQTNGAVNGHHPPPPQRGGSLPRANKEVCMVQDKE